jgi:ATP-dependent DNA ligase
MQCAVRRDKGHLQANIEFTMKRLREPIIPTRGTKVPAGKDWFHEIKHDGYRLIVQREGKRVRLFTRNGYDWTDRYPLIVDATLRNRASPFVMPRSMMW